MKKKNNNSNKKNNKAELPLLQNDRLLQVVKQFMVNKLMHTYGCYLCITLKVLLD